jgi:peptidoglycan hydrolase CwlO-like protein
MSAISEFAERVAAHQSATEAAIQGVADDVNALKDLITELQESAGEITPEDQALLDEVELKAAELAEKVSAVNEMTPPEPPVEE